MCKISGLVVAIVDAGEITQKFIENIKQIIQQSEQVLIVYTKGQKSSLDQCRNGCSRMFQVSTFFSSFFCRMECLTLEIEGKQNKKGTNFGILY